MVGSGIRVCQHAETGLDGKWPLPFAELTLVRLPQMQQVPGSAEPFPRQGVDWPGEDTAGTVHL